MTTALATFIADLTRLLDHASALAEAPVKWKDADLPLRHALPVELRAHTTDICVATQRHQGAACRIVCLPDATWWAARNFQPHWRSCHARVEEYALPIVQNQEFMGTVLIGPYPLAISETQRSTIQRVAAWVHDAMNWLSDRRMCALQGVRQVHGGHPALQQALACLHADPRRDYSLTELAAQIGISPSRLTHLCKAETGRSFSQWREEIVCARAQQLLANNDLPIAMIATTCGYQNPVHFTAAFKRVVGHTPSSFRTLVQTHEIP